MRRRFHTDEETGELNIVPYLDVVVNLVMFMLLSMTGLVTLGALNVSAPRMGGEAAVAAAESGPRLLLTVAIGRQGFYLAGAPGALGQDAGPVDPKRPPTIPLRPDGGYDYPALTARLVALKERFPGETQLILAAEASIAYDVLVQTMDACRERVVRAADGTALRTPLFFDVSLSVLG